jgi:hypothetical protein
MRSHIIRMLRQAPGGHTLFCLHKHVIKRKLPDMGTHFCPNQPRKFLPFQGFAEALRSLLEDGSVERVGAYYFMKEKP